MNSFLSTEEILVRNEAIWKSDDMVKNVFESIRTMFPLVNKYHEIQNKKENSGTIIKTAIKTDLLAISFKISDSGLAYATSINDPILEAELKLSRSKLSKYPQVILYDTMSAYYKKVLPLKHLLKHLDSDDLDKMYKLIKDFKASIPLAAANINESKTATMNIKKCIKSINELFRTMDKHIAPYKYNFPDFYNDYMNSRKVIDLKGKRRKKTKTQALSLISPLENGAIVI